MTTTVTEAPAAVKDLALAIAAALDSPRPDYMPTPDELREALDAFDAEAALAELDDPFEDYPALRTA